MAAFGAIGEYAIGEFIVFVPTVSDRRLFVAHELPAKKPGRDARLIKIDREDRSIVLPPDRRKYD